jgi:hypothetical protein
METRNGATLDLEPPKKPVSGYNIFYHERRSAFDKKGDLPKGF